MTLLRRIGIRSRATAFVAIMLLSSCSDDATDTTSSDATAPPADLATGPNQVRQVRGAGVDLDPSALFERVDEPDLLVGKDVRDMVQDRHGFMWFGLREGDRGALVRFDGTDMVAYRHDPDDDRSLTNNSIWMVDVDLDGNLWVGTVDAGLQRYDAATDDFTRFLPDLEDPESIPSLEVKAMVDIGDGLIWFATTSGLVSFDKESSTFELVLSADQLPDPSIRALLYVPSTNELWLGTRNGGLSVYGLADGDVRSYQSDPEDETTLPSDSIDEMLLDADGTIWLGTRGGLARYNVGDDNFTRFLNDPEDPSSIAANEVGALMQDGWGRIWLGLNTGMDVMDPATGDVIHLVNQPDNEASLPASAIRSIFQDDFGAIWISTLDDGVSRLSPLRSDLAVHRHDPADPTTVSTDMLVQMWPTSEGVMVSGIASVDRFDGERFDRLVPQAGTADAADTEPSDAASGESGEAIEWPTDATSYIGDAERNVWLSRTDEELIYFDREAQTFTSFPAPQPADIGPSYVNEIRPNGDLWFNIGGAGMAVLSDGEYLHSDDFSVDKTLAEDIVAWSKEMYFDEQRDVYWILGRGIVKLDTELNAIDTYFYNPDYDPEAGPGPENDVGKMVFDEDGMMWLAGSAGLHRFNPDSGEYEALYTEGLPSVGLRGLAIDDDGRLWSMSENSFVRFDPATETFTLVAPHEGIVDLSVRDELEFGPDGTLYTFAEEKGLISFHPDTVVENPLPPHVVLTDVKLFGVSAEPGAQGSVLPVAASELSELNLDHGDDHVSFSFAGVGYQDAAGAQFEYRLAGFEDDWILTDNTARSATYTNLPPGEYTFEVRAANSTGVWGETQLRLPVHVAAPWWANTIAYAVYALIAVGALALFVRWRTSRVNARNRALEAQLEERRKAQEEKDVLIDALEEQADRLQGVMDATPTSIMLIDQDCRLITANRAAAGHLGDLVIVDDANVTSIAGVEIVDLLGSQDWTAPHLDQVIWRSIVVADADGGERHVVVAFRPIDATFSHERGWVIAFDDITDQRELEHEAERQRQLAALGRFAAGIAHDVNNVLTAIGLNVDLLQMGRDLDPAQRERIGQIGDQARRADQFIAQVLDYSRRSVTTPEIVDLGALVREELDSMAVLVPDEITLEVSTEDGALVLIDPANAQQVVLNLVLNARDASSPGDAIQVTIDTSVTLPGDGSTADQQWVCLSVADEGCGIPASKIDSIFEPFVTTKPVGEGTGLGLAQVSGIVSQNGGHIEVDSLEGVGSTFRVYLPAVEVGIVGSKSPNGVAAIARDGSAGEPAGGELVAGDGQTVLIVDDDQAIREALADILAERGFQTVSESGGAGVLSRWSEYGSSIDLIITDLVMPTMLGSDLARELRLRGVQVPIIGVSGVIDQHGAETSAAEISVWLRKPIKRESLLYAVANALASNVGHQVDHQVGVPVT